MTQALLWLTGSIEQQPMDNLMLFAKAGVSYYHLFTGKKAYYEFNGEHLSLDNAVQNSAGVNAELGAQYTVAPSMTLMASVSGSTASKNGHSIQATIGLDYSF
jgi:outer membrane autotransporter protein